MEAIDFTAVSCIYFTSITCRYPPTLSGCVITSLVGQLIEKALEQYSDEGQLAAEAMVAFNEVQGGFEFVGVADAVLEGD